MALVIADRVKETTTTTGTGAITLAGAVATFQNFVAGIGHGNTCYYAITSGSNWEIGLGTVTDSPDTLSRTTILDSSAHTATLTFGDTEFDDVNNGTLTLIDNAGLSKTYTIKNDYGAMVATEFNAGASRGVAAKNLAQAVENAGGHNGAIYAMDSSGVRFSSGGYDFSDGVVNFKQATSGKNTTITTAASFDDTTDVNIGSAFTDSHVTLSGTSTVFATYPGPKSVHLDASGNLSHTVDISSDTNLVSGTNITLSGDTLNVDDAFLVNDASDTTTGTITAGGFTTAGTLTVDSVGISTVQTSGESFVDNDTSLMTSASIADKIEAYSYSTTTGTVTSVAISGTDGIDVDSGSPITSSGTITLGLSSIANAKLANSSITVSDGSSSTAVALGGTMTFSGTSNEVTVAESSGTVTIGLPDDVTIAGDLTVNGDTVTVNTATLSVEDPLIILANGNNAADSVDIGFYGLYDTSGSQDIYAGLFRDASDSGKFKLFKDLQAAPTTTVNVSGAGYAVATLVANIEGDVTGDVIGNADTVTTNANLTGHITSSGNATSLGAFTVVQLSSALSDASISGNNNGDVTLAGSLDYITISGQEITRNAIDLAADVTGTLPASAVQDKFLRNDGSDTTTGTITAGGFTTTGTWTFDESTSGTIGITTIQDSGSSFSDNDTSLMTSAAILDKIQATGGSVSDIDDLGDVSYGGTETARSFLINNEPGSAPLVAVGSTPDAATNNIAIGYLAQRYNRSGDANIAFGPSALSANLSGSNNIAMGDSALSVNTGSGNIAIGKSASMYHLASHFNIAFGHGALQGNSDGTTSTTGDHNIGIGYEAGNSIETGDYNTGLGYYALSAITTGGHNIAIGHTAGANVTEGGNNILLGYQAGNAATTQSNILAIGLGAGSSATGSLGASIGPYAGENNTADNATFLGPYAGKSHTSGDYPVYVGHYAGYYSTDGDNNVGIGKYALMGSSGNTTGNDGNTAIGTSALAAIRTGDSNTAIGITAGHDTTTGSYNIYVGYRAGYANTTSSNLLFIGNTDEGSNGTLIKGDMANKFLAVGKADVTLATEDATLQVYPNGTNDAAYFAQMPGSHTGDLIRIENSSGTALFKVDKDGDITATSITASVSVTTPYTTITGDTTVTTSNEVVFANATSGEIDVTLYLAASNGGKTLTIKKTDSSANAVSILRAGSETIDGATSSILYHQNEAITLISDNSNWMII